jgi:DNA-binding transcriptional regulator YiaG
MIAGMSQSLAPLSSDELAHHIRQVLCAVGVTPPLSLSDAGMAALQDAIQAAAAAGTGRKCVPTLVMGLSEWVLSSREAAGLTQAQLGERVGVGKGNVSAWENSRHEPSYAQLLEIGRQTGWPHPLPMLP